MAHKHTDGELIRWGILIGGMLGNMKFARQATRSISSDDAPLELMSSVLAAIERDDRDSTREQVGELIQLAIEDEETALAGVLRRVQMDVVERTLDLAQQNLRFKRELDPEAWIQWVRDQADMVERKMK